MTKQFGHATGAACRCNVLLAGHFAQSLHYAPAANFGPERRESALDLAGLARDGPFAVQTVFQPSR